MSAPKGEATNPDARPEPLVIDQFEGEYVRLHSGKLPAINLEMDQGFTRGTHVRFQVEARVRNIGYPESTDKEHKGQLVREHRFVIEEVALVGAMSADEANPGVGGSASRQIEERDDFGAVVQDCWYDASDLIVYHRGACDACYSRVPPEVVEATVSSHIGGAQPVDPHDPGF